jgi:MOSC domain-containing protein YiiM
MTSVARIHQLSRSDGGVPKLPLPTAWIGHEGMEGDRQRDLAHHGGPQRALCLFSLELIQDLQREGHPIVPGAAGENITLVGLDWSLMRPGTQLALGDEVQIEITSFTAPCRTIMRVFHDGRFSRISEKSHPGSSRVYASVLREGAVSAGDLVQVLRSSSAPG